MPNPAIIIGIIAIIVVLGASAGVIYYFVQKNKDTTGSAPTDSAPTPATGTAPTPATGTAPAPAPVPAPVPAIGGAPAPISGAPVVGGGTAVNCVYTGPVLGTCSATACGTTGTQTKTYTVTTAAANGGTACPTNTTQACTAPACLTATIPDSCVKADAALKSAGCTSCGGGLYACSNGRYSTFKMPQYDTNTTTVGGVSVYYRDGITTCPAGSDPSLQSLACINPDAALTAAQCSVCSATPGFYSCPGERVSTYRLSIDPVAPPLNIGNVPVYFRDGNTSCGA
jgi:hypothetical protein